MIVCAAPGPAAYRLPPTYGYQAHDPSRLRGPCYTLHGRGDYKHDTLGPGPAYNLPCVTRKGTCGAPSWSFAKRYPTRNITTSPGPAAYRPECCPHKEQIRPRWSLGARRGYQPNEVKPPPNAYMIRFGPGTPVYSFQPKLVGYRLKPTSPGPAYYYAKNQSAQLQQTPRYSFHPSLPVRNTSTSPGPAAYGPDLYDTKPRSHAFSFGKRHGARAPPMVVPKDLRNR